MRLIAATTTGVRSINHIPTPKNTHSTSLSTKNNCFSPSDTDQRHGCHSDKSNTIVTSSTADGVSQLPEDVASEPDDFATVYAPLPSPQSAGWYVTALASWRSIYRFVYEAEDTYCENHCILPSTSLATTTLQPSTNTNTTSTNTSQLRVSPIKTVRSATASVLSSASVQVTVTPATPHASAESSICAATVVDDEDEQKNCFPSVNARAPAAPINKKSVYDSHDSTVNQGSAESRREKRVLRAKNCMCGFFPRPSANANSSDIDVKSGHSGPSNGAHSNSFLLSLRGDPSRLTPQHRLLDALLGTLTVVGCKGPPLQAFAVSLVFELVAAYLKEHRLRSLQAASCYAVARGFCYAHLFMSLPSYARFTLREWLIQQTRMRVCHSITLGEAPAPLRQGTQLIDNRNKINSGDSEGDARHALATFKQQQRADVDARARSLSEQSQSKTQLRLPSLMSLAQSSTQTVYPICICRMLQFVVRRLAHTLLPALSDDDKHASAIASWGLFSAPPCDCREIQIKRAAEVRTHRETVAAIRRVAAIVGDDDDKDALTQVAAALEQSSLINNENSDGKTVENAKEGDSRKKRSANRVVNGGRLPDGLCALPDSLARLHELSKML